MSLFDELKRRKVVRVALVYAATAFAVLQAAEIMLPRLGLPDWTVTLVVVLSVLGFPIAVVLAWALELRPDGSVQRTTGPSAEAEESTPLLGRATLIATGALVLLGAGLSAGWWLGTGDGDRSGDSTVTAEPSVAVLPFDNLSDDPEQGYFADGLTEEILNALAALPDLLVTARTSSFFYKDKDVPVDEIAERLGVDHILEGSVRRAGDQVRVTAQLIRASDGFHLWSNAYDRPVDDIFNVQTDIAAEVASVLGILLDARQRDRMEGAGVQDPEAFALYARGSELYQLAHGGAPQIPTLAEANVLFDRAWAQAPDLWAARYQSADLYSHMLLDLASGVDPATLPTRDVARIREEHDSRLRDAARAAPNDAARDFVEITRRNLSEDWSGLGALVRQAFGHTDACGFDQWMHVNGPAFGMAEAARDFFLRGTRCNALDESNWIHAAASLVYAGDLEHALEVAERGLEVADLTGFGLEELRLEILVGLGRFDAAKTAVYRLDDSENTSRLLGELWVAAGRGDADGVAALRERLEEDRIPGIDSELSLLARSGDRAGANALAAAIDARPGGPMFLMTSLYFCLCGAPFDLEVTPNLSERLDEAGLDWPPTAPIRWPLKWDS